MTATAGDHRPAMSSPKRLINLLRGWPNPSLLPTAEIKAAANAALSDTEVSTPGLLYGPDEGYLPLRNEVAKWLTHYYRPPGPVGHERICITGGASQNLARILAEFSDPIFTRNVWMVSPTYFLACRIFEDAGFGGRLRSVPEDDEGIDIGFLAEQIKKSEQRARAGGNDKPTLKPARSWNKIYRHLIYAVPTFSNPSSKMMSLRRRQQLVSVAREYDALIITDDVYDHLQWPARPECDGVSAEKAVMPRIVDVDRELDGGSNRLGADGFGNAISNGSFSKVSGPGCRTGWAEGTDKLAYGLSQAGSSASGGAPSQLTATFMAKLLETNDLQRHISHTLQPAYARRYRGMISAIEKYLLPLEVQVPQSDRDTVGGYFIWLALPSPLIAEDVASEARKAENLIIGPGPLFGVYGDADDQGLKRNIRLCFSWEEEDLLQEGIQRLSRVIRSMQNEHLAGHATTSTSERSRDTNNLNDFR